MVHEPQEKGPFNSDRHLRTGIIIEGGGGSETLRRQSIATRRYPPTSRMQDAYRRVHERARSVVRASEVEAALIVPQK